MRYYELVIEGWDHYMEIGHKRGTSQVYYLLPGGVLKIHDFHRKRDNHDMSPHGDEAKAIAVGRIDPTTKKISVRTPLAAGNSSWFIPQAKLDYVRRILQRQFPEYEIWYFGNAAKDIRRIDVEEGRALQGVLEQ